MKQRTINSRPWRSRMESCKDGFVWVFENDKHKIRLSFPNRWMELLIEKLWEHLEHEQRRVLRGARSMCRSEGMGRMVLKEVLDGLRTK